MTFLFIYVVTLTNSLIPLYCFAFCLVSFHFNLKNILKHLIGPLVENSTLFIWECINFSSDSIHFSSFFFPSETQTSYFQLCYLWVQFFIWLLNSTVESLCESFFSIIVHFLLALSLEIRQRYKFWVFSGLFWANVSCSGHSCGFVNFLVYMTNLDSIFKSRDITLPTKVYLVKAMVFPGVMHGCENWTVKKAERRRIDVFELWCWRRLLRVPWTTRRSNQSILKISPGCSLEELMLQLKLQYFGHFTRRADSLEKTLRLGRIGGRRRKGQQRMRWLDGLPTQWTWVWVNSGSWWWTGRPGVLRFMGSQRVGHDWATELNWWVLLNILISQINYLPRFT